MNIRIAGIAEDSIVDGPGLRYVIFVQGCPHHCEGCHNPETHDFSGGRITDTDNLYEDIIANPLIKGVTFSGGEPFCQPEELYDLAIKLKEKGINITTFSGWTFEQLIEKGKSEIFVQKLLEITDILIDGPFILSQRTLLLQYRGSRNQRVLDCKKSIELGEPVLSEYGLD